MSDLSQPMQGYDRTHAEALRLAKEHLEKMGWKYDAADIGVCARNILKALQVQP